MGKHAPPQEGISSFTLGPSFSFLLLLACVVSITFLAAINRIGSDVVTGLLGSIIGGVVATQAHRMAAGQAVTQIETASRLEQTRNGESARSTGEEKT